MTLAPHLLSLLSRRRAPLLAALVTVAVGLGAALVESRRPPPPVKPPPARLAVPAAPVVAPPPPIPREQEPKPTPPPPAAPAPVAASAPAWQLYARPAMVRRPMVAIIIDDMGLDRRRSARIVALPGPLTISFMAYAGHLAEQAADAHDHGHELMMHMPMQPLSDHFDSGPDSLSEQLPADELRRRVDANLARFSGYVGVNNHMGSRFTADAAGMRIVMEELRKHGLLFIDSMTTGKSTGMAMAREVGVPAAARDVFLDDIDDRARIAEQLAKAEAQARRTGMAIAIGHPRDNTISALADWLPQLAERGITLVPVTAIIRAGRRT